MAAGTGPSSAGGQREAPRADLAGGAAGGNVSSLLGAHRLDPHLWEQVSDWDDAVAASARPSVFLTRNWLSAWWRHFGEGLEPCLIRVSDRAGSTVGLAPLYLERAPGARRWCRRLALLGDRHAGSEYLGLVARAGREREVAAVAIGCLTTGGVGWDVAELSGLVDGDPAGAALEGFLSAGARLLRREHHPCSRLTLPGDFESYLAGLSPKFRQIYRQRANKLRRNCHIRFVLTSSEDELPAHLEALFEMHQGHWAATGHTGAFADPRMRRFYHDVASRFLQEGGLRFWHLEVDGVLRASQFGFVHGGVLHSLQEAYDTTFRPPGVGGLGVVLRGHVLQACIEERLRQYDFLGGNEDFKTRWGTSEHHVRHLRFAAAGTRGRMGWAATFGAEEARSELRRAAPEVVVSTVRAMRDLRSRRSAGNGR